MELNPGQPGIQRTPSPSLAPTEAPLVASLEAQQTGAALTKENQVDMGAEETGAPASPRQRSWLVRHFSLLLRRDRQAQKAGQLFSGLLALNVVFLGGAFICSMIFNNVAITLGDVWILLAVLKALSILWLLYYAAGTTRRPHAVLHRDPHAGPIWVRGECQGAGGMESVGRESLLQGRWQWPPGPARLPGALRQLHHLPQRLPHGLRCEPHLLQVAAGARLPCHRDRLHRRPGDRPSHPCHWAHTLTTHAMVTHADLCLETAT